MMHYLSVHDLVWINATLTGTTPQYDFQKLEACMAAQYSYGQSTNVPLQAANFLETALTKAAFTTANRRTAFIAVASFLNANGYSLKVDDVKAADIIRRVAQQSLPPTQAIAELASEAQTTLRPGVALRQLVTHICNEHTAALQHLAQDDE